MADIVFQSHCHDSHFVTLFINGCNSAKRPTANMINGIMPTKTSLLSYRKAPNVAVLANAIGVRYRRMISTNACSGKGKYNPMVIGATIP